LVEFEEAICHFQEGVSEELFVVQIECHLDRLLEQRLCLYEILKDSGGESQLILKSGCGEGEVVEEEGIHLLHHLLRRRQMCQHGDGSAAVILAQHRHFPRDVALSDHLAMKGGLFEIEFEFGIFQLPAIVFAFSRSILV